MSETASSLNRWGIEKGLTRIVEGAAISLFVLGGGVGVAYDHQVEHVCAVAQMPGEPACQTDEGLFRDLMVFSGSGILLDAGTLVAIGASAALRRR